MRKNVASQSISAQLFLADGTGPFIGTARVAITIDNGVQNITPSGDAVTHEGRGLHSYNPTQAETNGDYVVFTFDDSGGLSIPQAMHVYTESALLAATQSQITVIAEDTTTDIPALIAALNDLSAAEVNTQADLALTDYDGPTNAEMIARTLLAASYFDPAADPVANVTLVATTTTNTDMVAEAPTAGANADQVWNELQSEHVSAGSFGEIATEIAAILVDTDVTIPGLIAALNNLSAAQVNTQVDAALTDYDGPTNAEMIARTLLAASYFDPAADVVANVTLVATTTVNTDMVAEAPTVDAIADANWDEVISAAEHNVPNSAGRRLRLVSEIVQIDGTVDDLSPTPTLIETDLTEADDHWNDALFVITSGVLAGQSQPILLYENLNGRITLDEPFTAAPANGVTFSIKSDHIHPVSQIVKAMWDEVLTTGTHNVLNSAGKRLRQAQESAGYLEGAVWIDTINGTAGDEDNENGTSDNPVDNLADANTIATSKGLSIFKFLPGSSITLIAAQQNQLFEGTNWILALGGQDIAGSEFKGAFVSGIGVGASESSFTRCTLNTCTLNPFHADDCALNGTLTFGAIGDYLLNNCHSRIAGMTTPIIDTGAAIANVNLAMPGYENGIEIRNLNAVGTDQFSISGKGQIIYAASCSGTVNQRGDWDVTNTGGVTIAADDNTEALDAAITTRLAAADITLASGEVVQTQASADKTWSTSVRTLTAFSTALAVSVWDVLKSAVSTASSIGLLLETENEATSKIRLLGTASGTPTITTMISDIVFGDDNQLKGRIITFDNDTTTVNLRGQSTDIIGGTAASNTLNFTTITDAPVSGDKFKVT